MAYTRPGTYPTPNNLKTVKEVEDYLKLLRSSLLENDTTGEYLRDRSPDNNLKELFVRPEWYGAKGDGVTDDTAAIQAAINACASGGLVLLGPKTYLISGAGLSGNVQGFQMAGVGKTKSRLNYTGAGVALTWGSTLADTANMRLMLRNFSISGTASGTAGLDICRFQEFIFDNIDIYGFSSGAALRVRGCNSGYSYNSDFRNSGTGIAFSVETIPTVLNNFISGQISGNGRAITFDNGQHESCTFDHINIASSTTSPAILLLGVAHKIKGCFFEGNKSGAGTYCVQIGDATGTCSGNLIEGNFFSETNVTYGVRIYSGNGNLIIGNLNGSVGMTAMTRVEAGGAQNMIWGNYTPGGATPEFSCAGSSADTFGIGFGTNLYKSAYGYVCDDSLVLKNYLYGGTAASDNLNLESTVSDTKGFIYFGTSGAYDQVNNRIGIGTPSPQAKLHSYFGTAGIIDTVFLHNYSTADSNNGTVIRFDGYYKHGGIEAYENPYVAEGGNLHFYTYYNSTTQNTGLYLTRTDNLGLAQTTFGTSAKWVFAIKNGTAPTSSVADAIQIFSVDSSDAAATLGLFLEQDVEAVESGDAQTHKIKVKINGTEYWLSLQTVT